MNDRDCMNALAAKYEAMARLPKQTDGERERLLALARQHREMAQAVLGKAA